MAFVAQAVGALRHAIEGGVDFTQQSGQAGVAGRDRNRVRQAAFPRFQFIVQESDFQGGHDRTSYVSSIRERAKRANIPSQTAEMLRAARPEPSLAQSGARSG